MAEFVYLNVNPDRKKISDCVTRSIHFTTGIPYNEVRQKLYHTAKLLDCEKLCMCCYSFFIENVLKCKRVNCDNMTIHDFAKHYPYGTYLVRMEGHISSLVNGTCYDIWDCRNQVLTDAWQVN